MVGVIAAAYPVTEIVAAPAIGVLTDWFGRRKWIYLGLTLSTLALFAFTLNTAVYYLVIVHAIQGLAAAMIVVSTLTMATDVSTVANRGRKMGIYDFANLGGYVVGIFAAGLLVRTYSLTTPFYFASGLAAVGAIFAYLTLKERKTLGRRSALSPIQTLQLLLSDKRTRGNVPDLVGRDDVHRDGVDVRPPIRAFASFHEFLNRGCGPDSGFLATILRPPLRPLWPG